MATEQLDNGVAVSTDPARLAALEALDILDTPPERAFERVTDLIKLIFGVEMGIVSMIDAHRQWYKSAFGMEVSEVPLDDTFCQYTLQLGRPVIVPDATKDPRFYANPNVIGGPKIKFYAGAPITTSEGQVIGTVCAIDRNIHQFGERETAILSHLAGIVMRELELGQLASTDMLTGAMTRRGFKEEADKHIALARRHGADLSCVVLDLDHFKSVNDTYGHATGDKVLSAVCSVLRDGLRKSDVVGRMGGEEFAVMLPHTPQSTAVEVAEKLRLAVQILTVPGSSPPVPVTASFGVAGLGPGDDIESLAHKADQALYEAKRAGRNRTHCFAVQRAADDAKPNRRRVLKAAQIVSNQGRSTIDCTVRSIWDTGVELAVPLPAGIPETFELLFKGASERRRCTTTRHGAGWIEAAYV